MLAIPLLLMGSLASYCTFALAAGRRPMHWVVLALALAAAGFFLLGGAELFHIADQFGNRMNTVFKFYYQAWLLLGIAGAIGMYYILAVPLRHAWVGESETTVGRVENCLGFRRVHFPHHIRVLSGSSGGRENRMGLWQEQP